MWFGLAVEIAPEYAASDRLLPGPQLFLGFGVVGELTLQLALAEPQPCCALLQVLGRLRQRRFREGQPGFLRETAASCFMREG